MNEISECVVKARVEEESYGAGGRCLLLLILVALSPD